MNLLGPDIGTTSCKASQFNEQGCHLAAGVCEYPIDNPQSRWPEQDIEKIWRLVQKL
jgi:gluconokinase